MASACSAGSRAAELRPGHRSVAGAAEVHVLDAQVNQHVGGPRGDGPAAVMIGQRLETIASPPGRRSRPTSAAPPGALSRPPHAAQAGRGHVRDAMRHGQGTRCRRTLVPGAWQPAWCIQNTCTSGDTAATGFGSNRGPRREPAAGRRPGPGSPVGGVQDRRCRPDPGGRRVAGGDSLPRPLTSTVRGQGGAPSGRACGCPGLRPIASTSAQGRNPFSPERNCSAPGPVPSLLSARRPGPGRQRPSRRQSGCAPRRDGRGSGPDRRPSSALGVDRDRACRRGDRRPTHTEVHGGGGDLVLQPDAVSRADLDHQRCAPGNDALASVTRARCASLLIGPSPTILILVGRCRNRAIVIVPGYKASW
jgi:hypothetical protein